MLERQTGATNHAGVQLNNDGARVEGRLQKMVGAGQQHQALAYLTSGRSQAVQPLDAGVFQILVIPGVVDVLVAVHIAIANGDFGGIEQGLVRIGHGKYR